jgi:histidinol dehydrogenase
MKVVRTFGRSAKTAEELIESLEQRGAVSTASVEPVVRKILAAVAKRGERAVVEYATKLDGLAKNQPLLVSREDMRAAWESTDPKLQAAMQAAQANIRAFAEAQKASEWTISNDGVKTGQIVRPLASVGCYVPGGRYPLPSTLLHASLSARPSRHGRHWPRRGSPALPSSIASAAGRPSPRSPMARFKTAAVSRRSIRSSGPGTYL